MTKKSDKLNTDSDTHEQPRFCRMNEGVMYRISDENPDDYDDSLNEESAGVGLAAMIQLGEALISTTSDALKSIKKRINNRIDVCLKAFNLRR